MKSKFIKIHFWILLILATQLHAQEKDSKKVKQTSSPNIKVINPAIGKKLGNTKSITTLSKQLNMQKYQAILRQHEIKVQSVKPKVQANTRIEFVSQNSQFDGEYDCDDKNREVFPGNPEICDGLDNNCNGDVDENVSTTFYLDADGDSWGDYRYTYLACDKPPGYSDNHNDCDDTNLVIYPGASDTEGNGIDENCNGKDG